jgi:hypothetical protein
MGGVDAVIDYVYKGQGKRLKTTLEKMTEIISQQELYSTCVRSWTIFQLFHLKEFKILTLALSDVIFIIFPLISSAR